MENKKTVLEMAHEIVNNRSEDKDRRYGSFEECMGRVSDLASTISGKTITVDDAFVMMISLKLSRESNYHKEDNIVDLLGYIQGWHDHRERQSYRDQLALNELEVDMEKRMDVIGQNGNDGLHYDKDGRAYAMHWEQSCDEPPTAEEMMAISDERKKQMKNGK